MARPKSGESKTSREAILKLADFMVRRRGYNGFSFLDLAKEIGVRKATLHHYFPTKAELMLEWMREQRRLFREWDERHSTLPAAERLEQYLEMFQKICSLRECVCPGGALAADWSELPAGVRRETRLLLDEQRDWITSRFRELGRPPLDAALFQAALMGGLQLDRQARWKRKTPELLREYVKSR